MTYAPRATCSGHEAIVSAIKYNSDGSFIASSSADRTARVWSAGSSEPGVLKQTCSGHEHGISDVCWHPHQPYIATASDDKSLGLWDLESGARIRSFHGHTHFVFCCKFHNLGSILVSGALDESVRYWDVRSGHCIKAIPAHSDPITALDLTQDGQLLGTCSSDGLVRLWDFATGHLLRTLLDTTSPPVATMQFSPNNQYLLASCLDQAAPVIKVWDWRDSGGERQGRVVRQLRGHSNAAYFVPAMFVHGSGLLSASEDGAVCIWDINSRKQDRAAAVAQKTDDAQGPTPAAGTAVENGGEKANGDLASEHANPDAINALDVHEASSTMAYTHVGSSDHSIFIGPLPPVAA